MCGSMLLNCTLGSHRNFFENGKSGGIGYPDKFMQLKSIDRDSPFEKKDGREPRARLSDAMEETTCSKPLFSRAESAFKNASTICLGRNFVGASRAFVPVEHFTKMFDTSFFCRKQALELLPTGVKG